MAIGGKLHNPPRQRVLAAKVVEQPGMKRLLAKCGLGWIHIKHGKSQ
jgi:hypothetical protein